MTIKKKIKDNFKIIEEKYGQSNDIVKRNIKFQKKDIGYIYLESVSSDDKISNFFMKDILFNTKRIVTIKDIFNFLKNSIPNSHTEIINNLDEIFYYLSSGYTAIFIDKEKKAIVIETKTKLDRGVSESTSEAIIRGPKDSFTENHVTNIGLIRKRIKDENLWMQEIQVGRRTKTKVTISYIQDIADKELVKKIKNKIKSIDIDGILDSGYIREFLLDNKNSSLPQFISTERPDLACSSLLQGKVVILVENSPFVLIIPALLIDFMHSPEDDYQKWINVSFTRILRIISFIMTIFLPGVYIALTTFNQEIIPNELLISLAVQREGVPFPTAIETLMMIITFEILRESDIRIPNASGSSIGIVGALVLGEAAVTAGIVSPIVIIIIGVTSISGLLFTDIDVVNGIRFWRIIVLIFSSTIGIVGFIISLLLFITKLASIEYNGIPYLSPIAPFNKDANKYAILRLPRNKIFKRPEYLSKKNQIKMREDNEN